MSKDSMSLKHKVNELRDEILKHFTHNGEVSTFKFEDVHSSNNDFLEILYISEVGLFVLEGAREIGFSLEEVSEIVVKELEKNQNHIWY